MMEARASVVVPAPAELVYGHIAAMELHPAWMEGLAEVHRTGDRRRDWMLDGPSGRMRWGVEITVDEPHRRFGFCMEAPGVVGFTMARIYPAGATTGLAIDRSLHVQDEKLLSWWGDGVRRLQRDTWRFRTTLMHATQGKRDLTSSLSGPSSASLFSSW